MGNRWWSIRLPGGANFGVPGVGKEVGEIDLKGGRGKLPISVGPEVEVGAVQIKNRVTGEIGTYVYGGAGAGAGYGRASADASWNEFATVNEVELEDFEGVVRMPAASVGLGGNFEYRIVQFTTVNIDQDNWFEDLIFGDGVWVGGTSQGTAASVSYTVGWLKMVGTERGEPDATEDLPVGGKVDRLLERVEETNELLEEWIAEQERLATPSHEEGQSTQLDIGEIRAHLAAYRPPTLALGSPADAGWVHLLEWALWHLGFAVEHSGGSTDGGFDRATVDALVAFQGAVGVATSGSADDDTWAAITAEIERLARPDVGPIGGGAALPVLGDAGETVDHLQHWLGRFCVDTENPVLQPSGTFDADTEAAVRLFQRWNGLAESGVVDVQVWTLIGEYASGAQMYFPIES